MEHRFFYGPLCHAPLLCAVLGRAVDVEPAVLDGYAVFWVEGQDFPAIKADAQAQVPGVLLRGVTAQDRTALDFYQSDFGNETREMPREMPVRAESGDARAMVYFPATQVLRSGAPWVLADWVARWGAIAEATARDVMALRGQRLATEVAARRGPMLVRGASRVRATQATPAVLRRRAGPDDLRLAAVRQSYANFFAVEEYDLAYRSFDGGFGPEVTRAVFVSGDAVTVLPYDPLRDRVLLVEQFRIGAMARGDGQPWLLEAIAGRVDPGESPQEAARREALEEAGLQLGALLEVANYYPSPGAKTEFLYSYVALCDLPDTAAGTFGLAAEAEDIRGHLVGFDDLMALVASGEVANAPLVLTAFWLRHERACLRAAAGGQPPDPRDI
ncbi:MAG: NUDIX domain-containing protein [Paracoccaceae bacterium]|nr:NUDIX domain-containing protein [Paracoccaceae bacterium]